jgi:hypothetical protein
VQYLLLSRHRTSHHMTLCCIYAYYRSVQMSFIAM